MENEKDKKKKTTVSSCPQSHPFPFFWHKRKNERDQKEETGEEGRPLSIDGRERKQDT